MTQLGGLGAGGQQIAQDRFETLLRLFDSRISALDTLIAGDEESTGADDDLARQLQILREAVGVP